MLTWLGYIDGIHVTIYSNTMDPMAYYGRATAATWLAGCGVLCQIDSAGIALCLGKSGWLRDHPGPMYWVFSLRAQQKMGFILGDPGIIWKTLKPIGNWVCLKMLCTPKPNGFADHYPYEMAIIGGIPYFQINPCGQSNATKKMFFP